MHQYYTRKGQRRGNSEWAFTSVAIDIALHQCIGHGVYLITRYVRFIHTHAYRLPNGNALRRWLPWGTNRRKVGELGSTLRRETGALLHLPLFFSFPLVVESRVESRLEIYVWFGWRPCKAKVVQRSRKQWIYF